VFVRLSIGEVLMRKARFIGVLSAFALGLALTAPPAAGQDCTVTLFPSPLPTAVVNVAYTQALSAFSLCLAPPLTWTMTGTDVPPGLTLSTSGVLSGTPTQTGQFLFNVEIEDSGDNFDSVWALVNVSATAPPTITTASALPAATSGTAYSQTLAATGGSPPYAWSVTAGSLPAGLALSGAGVLSGTPTATGAFGFTIQVKDSAGATASLAFTLTVSAPANCTYALYPGGQAFPVAGGSGTITVTAAAGCQWTAKNTLSWVTITGATSGSGNGSIAYTVAANTGPWQSGTFTVAGAAFNVEEASATAQGLTAAGSMAQLAWAGTWNTTITLVNTGKTPAEVFVNFIGDNGSPVLMPVAFPQPSQNSSYNAAAPLLASTLDRTIAAGAQLVISSVGTTSEQNVEGWAQVLANGTVGGQAVFADSETIGLQEAVSPVETRNPSAFFLPFNYTSGYQTGIAIANLSNQTVNVPVALRGANGTSLGPVTPIQLGPYAHESFMLAGNYPAVANQFGSMELDTPTGGQISALGIRAAPDGALTTVPVFASTDASNGTMAQLVSGGTWNITLTLENTSATTAAQATLSFFDDNGNPLQLPLTYPLSGSATATPASTVTQTIGPEAELVIATAGSTGTTTTEGWAQLTVTGASVGGSEVYADTSAGIVQEAAVGVETRNPPTGFLLPFNYTNGYTTGIAVANLTNQAVTIPVVLKDDQGNSLGTAASITLQPHAHESFLLATNYPAVANHFGTLELDQPTGSPATAQISAIGLRATPGNAITSVPVLAK
jgi:hypothetical protein